MEVRDFRFLIFDDRYSVPTLNLVQAAGVEGARQVAHQIMADGKHHLAVEVWEDEALLFTLGQTPGPPDRPSL